MTSKSKKAPLANGSDTVDIPHEVVESGQKNLPSDSLLNPEDQIRLDIAQFNLADQGIAMLKGKFAELAVNGIDDKEGYKAVREAWGEVRTIRTGLEKKGLQLRNRYKVITTAIGKEQDRLIDLVTPLENDLHRKWKDIDELKDKIQREKEAAEQREMMARIEEVMALGMVFRDGFYAIGETISMDVATLRSLPVENYDRLKEAIRAKKSELDKAEADSKAEKQRQVDEFNREQADLKRQQEELAAERERMRIQQYQLERDREEAAFFKLENRVAKFKAMGMVRQGDQLVYDNGMSRAVLGLSEIAAWAEESFNGMLDDWKTVLAKKTHEKKEHDASVKREQEALDEKKKFIANAMEIAGLSFSYTGQSFVFEDKNASIMIPFAELIVMSMDDIAMKAGQIADDIRVARKKTKQQEEELAAETRRLQKLAMGDKERLAETIRGLCDQVETIDPATYKTKKYQGLAAQLKTDLGAILNIQTKV